MRNAVALMLVAILLLATCSFAATRRPQTRTARAPAVQKPKATTTTVRSTSTPRATTRTLRPTVHRTGRSGTTGTTGSLDGRTVDSVRMSGGKDSSPSAAGPTTSIYGRETAGAKASSRWVYVEPPSEEEKELQAARDEAFRAALEQYRKDYPWKMLPGDE